MTALITIGSRGSALAQWQANHVAQQLRAQNAHVQVDIRIIKTKGDLTLDVPLSQVGGKGLFIKEIEDALINGEVDLAVHSLKDMPAQSPEALHLAAFPTREDPRDAWISRDGVALADLPIGATVGTSSLRRKAFLIAQREDLSIEFLRGNIDTRIKRLHEGRYDAIILAAAGLHRLGLSAQIAAYLPLDQWIPAVGQGVLALQTRREDIRTTTMVAALSDEKTAACVAAERAFLAMLGSGGCQVPIAGHAHWIGPDQLKFSAMVAHPDGKPMLQTQATGLATESVSLGKRAADTLLNQGAATLLSMR